MISRRFLLDQMLDLDVAQIQRDAGHDVIRVSDVGLATADDSAILRRAIDDDRVLRIAKVPTRFHPSPESHPTLEFAVVEAIERSSV